MSGCSANRVQVKALSRVHGRPSSSQCLRAALSSGLRVRLRANSSRGELRAHALRQRGIGAHRVGERSELVAPSDVNAELAQLRAEGLYVEEELHAHLRVQGCEWRVCGWRGCEWRGFGWRGSEWRGC